MKRGVVLLFLLVLLAFYVHGEQTYCMVIDLGGGEVQEVNCCGYDSLERDTSEENCEECGHVWGGSSCCDDNNEYFCIWGGGSCIDGISYQDHCVDGVQNCDEDGIDCGGNDCRPCCSDSIEDNFCPPGCSADEDIDCCAQLFRDFEGEIDTNAILWSETGRCCQAGDYWCAEEGSCVSGRLFSDPCTDGIKNCGELGVDCGGSCAPCELIADGVCSFIDLVIHRENDPDCCSLLGGTYAENRCCLDKDWCHLGRGSCVSGQYYVNHCQDSTRNTFCAEYLNNKKAYFDFGSGTYKTAILRYSQEIGVDCGGVCGACGVQGPDGSECDTTYDCLESSYCSRGHCCPKGSYWNIDCCVNNGACI